MKAAPASAINPAAASRPPRKVRLRTKLLLAFVAFFVACLLAEGVLWLVAPPPPRAMIGRVDEARAAIYGWCLAPNAVLEGVDPDTQSRWTERTNSHGWKDVEHSWFKPAGVARILVVGDSFTYGVVPIPQLYTRQLEAILRARSCEVEVITMGVGGWGTDQVLAAIEHEGLQYKPDIVIYAFCTNDIGDNTGPNETMSPSSYTWQKRFRYELVADQLVKVKLSPRPLAEQESTRDWLKRQLLRSALLYRLNELRLAIKNRNWKPERAWQPFDPTAALYPYSGGNLSSELKKAYDLLAALVDHMNRTVRNAGARLIVFSVNGDNGEREFRLESEQIKAGPDGDYVEKDGRRHAFDLRQPVRELERICHGCGVPLVSNQRAYARFQNDGHANAAGNRAMAEDIADFILDQEPFRRILMKAK
jgi:lysophospholipase L1-like esterase